MVYKKYFRGEIVIPKLKSYRITDLAKAVDNNCKLKLLEQDQVKKFMKN